MGKYKKNTHNPAVTKVTLHNKSLTRIKKQSDSYFEKVILFVEGVIYVTEAKPVFFLYKSQCYILL